MRYSSTPVKPLHYALFFFALTLALFALYVHSLHGLPLMDDDILIFQNPNITRDSLASAPGLARTWSSLTANQDFYPLTLTSWWLQFRLFHTNYFPYHLINLALHALNATLLLLILNRLRLPLFVCLLSSLLFAIHPINVQSVAWMSQHKSTLSACFYFLAILAFLRACHPLAPSPRFNANYYILALLLFALAMLAKPLTMTLAACLPLLAFLRFRRITFRDLLTALPFFALAVPVICFTSWVQTYHLGSTGPVFHLSFLQRLLLAPNIIAHYLSKLAVPFPLSFSYEKWIISPHNLLLYLAPCALLALLLTLVIVRKNPVARSSLLAFLWFIIALSPALGLRPIFWHLYYYVVDHVAYLPAIPLFVLFAAGVDLLVNKLPSFRPRTRYLIASCSILLPLAALAFAHARHFADPISIWQHSMNASPRSALPYMSLAVAIASEPDPDIPLVRNLLERSIAQDPAYADAHLNLGRVLLINYNDPAAARAHFQAALDNVPKTKYRSYADSLVNLAFVLDKAGDTPKAIELCLSAVHAAPKHVEAWFNLGTFYLHANDLHPALNALNQATVLNPLHASAHANLGIALRKLNRIDDARLAFTRAIQADTRPDGSLGPAAAFAQNALDALPSRPATSQPQQ